MTKPDHIPDIASQVRKAADDLGHLLSSVSVDVWDRLDTRTHESLVEILSRLCGLHVQLRFLLDKLDRAVGKEEEGGTVAMPTKTCPKCNGLGRWMNWFGHWITCDQCGGSGQVNTK